jgi:hypothetical protein
VFVTPFLAGTANKIITIIQNSMCPIFIKTMIFDRFQNGFAKPPAVDRMILHLIVL